MATEIERKFLVVDASWRAQVAPGGAARIDQGYLCADVECSVRVRIRENAATLTVMGATRGIAREEFEYAVPLADAEAMLALCGGRRVSKRRSIVVFADRTWEIDEFTGSNDGLVVAEIELTDPNEVFDKPAWAGTEISDRPEYYNANLALHPYASWSRERHRTP